MFTSNEAAYIVRAAEYLGFSFEAITCLVFSYIGYFNGHGMSFPVMLRMQLHSWSVCLFHLFSIRRLALFDIGLAVPAASVWHCIFYMLCTV